MTAPYDPTISDWGNKYDVAEGPNHGIDETVTGGAFASVRDAAWHKLGVVVDHQVTARELLRLAHCDFPIMRAPVTAELNMPISPGSESYIRRTAVDERRYNICRQHPETGDLQILGQASKDYPLWTPEDVLVGFGDSIIETGAPTVSTCGALDGGRQVFMSFELPQFIKVGGMTDEEIRIWLLVHTSFNQTAPTTASLVTIRSVCRNTIRAGLAASISQMKIKKTKNADLQAAQARTALGLVQPHMDEFQRRADALIETQLTTNAFINIIEKEFGPGEEPSKAAQTLWDDKKGKLVELFTDADTQANCRNTAWAGLNAVGEYVDWMTKVQKGQGDETRLKRSLFADKSTENPKAAMRRALFALAGLEA